MNANNIKIQRVLNTGTANLCITQDKDGLLWIATESGGVLSYDGNEVKKVKIGEDENLFEVVLFVFVDSEGIIWSFVQGQGLFSYDKNTGFWKNYKAIEKNSDSLTSNNVCWSSGIITEDKEGLIWVGTDNGLNSYDKKTGKITQYRHIPDNANSLSNNSIRAIFTDKEGFVWIGTEDGLNYYNKKTNTFSCYKHDSNNINSLSDSFIYTINEDKNGILWIGTRYGGMCSFDKRTKSFTNYKHDPNNLNSLSCDEVYHIAVDHFNNLWICNEGGTGIDRYNIKTNTFENYRYNPKDPNSLSSNEILYSFEDNTGIIWLLDSMGGINKCTLKHNIFKDYLYDPEDPFSLISDNLSRLHEDKQGNIWIGAFKSGLSRYISYDKFEKFRHINSDPFSLPGSTVLSVIDAPNNKLWIGCIGEFICLFDIRTKRVIKNFKSPYPISPPCNLIIDNKKLELLWFVSYFTGGLFNLNTTTGEFFQYKHNPADKNSVSNKNTFNILQDKDILWLGTGGDGLCKFDKTTGKCTYYKHDPNDKNSISGNVVIESFIDSKGNFWVTTEDGGLNKFDRETEKFTSYGTECGFLSKSTRHILEDKEGCLWISTNYGIVKFDPNLLKVIKRFTEDNGLSSNQFDKIANALKDSNGNFWFSKVKGLCKFNPEEANKIEPNKHIPPIVLTSFKSKIYKENGLKQITNIKLPWSDNSFEFTFAALDYMDPGKNQYAYKLEGFDKDWNYIGTNHSGRYTNISPGRYTLCLKGSNNDGIWNEEGLSIKITITPPFWMRWWFRGLVVIVLLGIIGGIFQLRARVLKERAISMKDHAIAKTAAQVAHDIRSPLVALGIVSKHLPELPEEKRIIIRNATLRINDIANNLLEQYKVKSEEKNIEAEDIKPELVSSLLDLLVSEKRIQMAHKSIELNLDIKDNAYSNFVHLDAKEFKRIISNLINNASEAIESKGTIRVALSKETDSELTIKIIDNGKGIPEDILPKIKQGLVTSTKKEGHGLGISSAAQSIKSWGGNYDIQSKVGEGTTFIVNLPIAEAPEWFQNKLDIVSGMNVIILDDDQSIHDVWETRFQGYIKNKQIVLEHFYTPSTFIEYCKNLSSARTLFLIDYELLGFDESGLDLIEELNLKNQAVLVTSRYEEPAIRTKIAKLEIKTIPKNFAPYIPITYKT